MKHVILCFGIILCGYSWGHAAPPAKELDVVWVTRPDSALSCDPQSGISLSEDAAELKKAKIPVYDSQKASDRKMHIQVCGAPKGTSNSFLIPRKKLSDALALGFQEVSTKHTAGVPLDKKN